MSKRKSLTPADEPDPQEGKMTLLKAIELLIAKPESIKAATAAILKKYRKRYRDDTSDDDIKELAANKVIQNYSYMAAFSGGATALAGVVPGLGTVLSVAGGATADMALCMKFQIEMVMAIAHIYEHDILDEEERHLCFIIAGLGAVNQAGQRGAKEVGSKAFTKMVQQYLKGPTLVAIKEIFKKVGITFTRKGLEKAIPFGIGVVIGFSVNKTLTWYIGVKARDFFQTN
jgi:uncharacterized protein (DUF697 family)